MFIFDKLHGFLLGEILELLGSSCIYGKLDRESSDGWNAHFEHVFDIDSSL